MNQPFQHKESHQFSPNVFPVFYTYFIMIIIPANLVPVSAISYSVFFILGLAGMFILFIKATYQLTARDNILEISIKLPVKIILRKVDLNKVESAEEVTVRNTTSPFKIKKSAAGISYLAKISTAVQLNLPGRRSVIVSTKDPARLIELVESLHR
jgi:hypothetical protein